jgi:hypothetical protein
MTATRQAITEALRTELASRALREEPPAIYALWLAGGRARLQQIPLDHELWAADTPPQILAAFADTFTEVHTPGPVRPGLHGAAFFDDGQREPSRHAQAPGTSGHSPRQAVSPELWAVDRAGTTYRAWLDQASHTICAAVLDHAHRTAAASTITEALDTLVTTMLGVTLPSARRAPEEPEASL